METFGYVHIYQLYEQNDETQVVVALPPIASTMVVLLAASALSVTTLPNAATAEAQHFAYRQRDRETVSSSSLGHRSYLQAGSQGPEVYQLQTQLRNWGFPIHSATPLAIDGVFGSQTEQVVREFQIYVGLKPDGIVGPRTKKALFTPRTSNEVLMLGSQSDRVLQLQKNLLELGWEADELPRTGVFDQRTEAAIRDFQALVDLQPDGIVGPKTASALTRICIQEGCGLIRPSNSLIAWRKQMRSRPKKS